MKALMFSCMMCLYLPLPPSSESPLLRTASAVGNSIEMRARNTNPIEILMKIETAKAENQNYNIDEYRQAIVAVLMKYPDVRYQVTAYLEKNPMLQQTVPTEDRDWWGLAAEISNPSRDVPPQQVMTGAVTQALEEKIVTAIVQNTWVCVSGSGYCTYDMYSCANQCQNCSCSTGVGLCYLPQACIQCTHSSCACPCCPGCVSARISSSCCFQCYNVKKPHHNKTTMKAPWCCCTRDECGTVMRETEERAQKVSMMCTPARCFNDIQTNEEQIRMNVLHTMIRVPVNACTITGMTYCMTNCAVCVNLPGLFKGCC